MNKYYKVQLYEGKRLYRAPKQIIVKKGLIYSKEIVTNKRIMICDNTTQGRMYYYYVLSSDFTLNNIASLEDVEQYIEKNHKYSTEEKKEIKKYVKKICRERSV